MKINSQSLEDASQNQSGTTKTHVLHLVWINNFPVIVSGGTLGECARGGSGLPGRPRDEPVPQERDEQGESHIYPGGKGEGVATGRSMERCHCQLMREESNL